MKRLIPTFVNSCGAGNKAFAVSILVLCIALVSNAQNQGNNYIRVRSPRVKIGSTATLESYTNLKDSVSVVYQYIDGLGQPLQTVQQQASFTGKDVVQPFAYDNASRDSVKYQPYTTGAGTPGSYRPDALTGSGGYTGGAQYQFYQQSSAGYKTDTKPYAEIGFDQSPMDRSIEQGAPGISWKLSTATVNGHTVKTDFASNNQVTFDVNTTAGNPGSRKVLLYTAAINSNQTRSLTQSGTYYPSGTLTVTISKDENWNAAATTDGCIGTTEEYKDLEGHVLLKRTYNKKGAVLEMLSTYYVYDDLDNLAFVLPPAANPDGGLSSASNQATIDALCYQYRYDDRHRLTQKKLPGKGWEYTVYNTIDQQVATQDSLQRAANQWIYTKYDAIGRTIQSGIWNNNNTAISRAALQTTINGLSILWETPAATGYTNNAWPTAYTTLLNASYYDGYGNMPANPVAFTAPTNYSQLTRGLLTASQTAVLNTPANLLWKKTYYDDLGRNITGYAQHYLGGTISPNNYDAVSTTYDFTNQVLATTRKHYKNSSGTAVLGVTIGNNYTYDHQGRKTGSWESLDGVSQQLLKLTYNELGQIIVKNLHVNGSTYLQTVNYAYNERGWLTQSTAPLFSMQLKYDDGTTPQYNGNIANQLWGTPGNLNKNFVYSYDRLNRLTDGISSEGYSEKSIDYDLNGNILHLTRQNNAAYTYNYSGNQLQSVNGLTTGTYTYDGNGNVKYDARNGKTNAYNLLNLPQSITASGFSLAYTYDAGGQKLQKNNGTITTDYIGGIQYENGSIIFIQTEEGRALKSGSTYIYEYSLADHLGDTRVTLDQNSATVAKQQDDYYPFGLEINRNVTAPKNEYLYNKKELQEELGQYDYGARFYDPYVARWTTIDELAEKYYSTSAYNYVVDDPIKNIDPDGKIVILAQGNLTNKQFAIFKKQFAQTVKFMNAHNTSSNLGALQKSSKIYYIQETNGFVNSFNGSETISWNPNLAKVTTNDESLSPATLLGHELSHAAQYEKHRSQYNKDSDHVTGFDSQYDTKEEKRVITGPEQTTARANGDIGSGAITRRDHNMKNFIPVSDPTSNGTITIRSTRKKRKNGYN